MANTQMNNQEEIPSVLLQGRYETDPRPKQLGKGAYGAVYSVIKSHTRETVAVKIISHPNDLTVCPTTVREIGLLKRLKKHANIVNMLDIEYFNNCYCIEFEYLSFDLSQYCAFYSPNNRWMKYCLFQILNGIKYLHKSQICHRDLKPQNILVSRKTMRVKIADFGLARTISVPKANITTQVVTLWYRAPELLLGTKKYNAAIDMWSFGCIMAELFNRKTLFAERSEIAQIFTIFTHLGTPSAETLPDLEKFLHFEKNFPQFKAKRLKDFIKNMDETGLNLVSKLLVYEPKYRLTARKALKHKFFDGISLELIEAESKHYTSFETTEPAIGSKIRIKKREGNVINQNLLWIPRTKFSFFGQNEMVNSGSICNCNHNANGCISASESSISDKKTESSENGSSVEPLALPIKVPHLDLTQFGENEGSESNSNEIEMQWNRKPSNTSNCCNIYNNNIENVANMVNVPSLANISQNNGSMSKQVVNGDVQIRNVNVGNYDVAMDANVRKRMRMMRGGCNMSSLARLQVANVQNVDKNRRNNGSILQLYGSQIQNSGLNSNVTNANIDINMGQNGVNWGFIGSSIAAGSHYNQTIM